MQFNQARGSTRTLPWETAHEAVVRRFAEEGYHSVPTMVYWNLAALPGRGAPISSDQPGVVALSGFSQVKKYIPTK